MNLREWNARQIRAWLRWSRRTRTICTPETVAAFAARWSEKHAAERLPRAA